MLHSEIRLADSDASAASYSRQLERLLVAGETADDENVAGLACDLLAATDDADFDKHSTVLISACAYLFEVGKSTIGISLGKEVVTRAEFLGNLQVQRRASNILGAQFCDIADFASAMTYLETAVTLARRLGDQTIEAACLANVIAVLQEMGHYKQAISMADRVLELEDESHLASMLKLQCASNGLFAAHRIGDADSAASFLSRGQSFLSSRTEPLRRAFFEKSRAAFLIDADQAPLARKYLSETISSIGSLTNPRTNALLTIALATCDWGLGNAERARLALQELYEESKRGRLYHHFVLQSLIKVFSDAATPVEAAAGLAYARELVEFTTSVKKAKFYRQLAHRREENEQRSAMQATSTAIDPFGLVKDWLIASDILAPSTETQPTERRQLAKHEELTIIHEDMAKLRAATLRRDIRTDAVDTAENWAIAAEFFDDETGQHCYRVGHLASMLARQIGMDETFCVRVEHAARLHDIGKIAVNEVILLKPGPLDASEMAAMRLHTEVGAQLLSGSDDPTLVMAVEVARHHHEWWNGAGYPVRLCGKEIPISARVCAFADVYDALTHARAYKQAWTHERALAEILRLGGTQFDPEMIAPFCEVIERYRTDLQSQAIPAFADMDANALISSRKRLLETIASSH